MSIWITSIVGVVTLGVLLDIIVPEGEINKYIKAVFALVTVLVIVAPLPRLIEADFDIGNLFNEPGEMQTDESFLQQVDWQIRAQNQERLALAFQDAEVTGGIANINYGESARDVVSVHVNLSFALYTGTRAQVEERLRVSVSGRLRVPRNIIQFL